MTFGHRVGKLGRWLCVALAAVFVLTSAVDVDAARRPSRRQIKRMIASAEQLFISGKYQDALDAYTKIYEATRADEMFYMVARCYEEMGNLEEALANYERFLSGDGPAAVQEKARLAADNLRKRLAVGTILLEVTPLGADVFLDGNGVGKAPLAPLQTAPGTHTVAVSLDGYLDYSQVVDVRGARELQLVVDLVKAPEPENVVTGPPPPPPADYTAAWAVLGTGVAVAAGGAVSFTLGELDHQKLADEGGATRREPGPRTQQEAQALSDEGDIKKLVGYVAGGVGAALIVTGTILFVLEGGEPEAEGAVDGPRMTRLGVTPVRGGAILGAGATF